MSRVEYRKGASPEVWTDLERESVAAIITDPPYGLGVGYGRGQRGIMNDTSLRELEANLPRLFTVLSRFGVAFFFSAPTMRAGVERSLDRAGFRVVGFAPWDKSRPGISRGVRYAYEECIIADTGWGDPFEEREPLVVPLRDSSLWTSGRASEHPNEKPIGLLRRCIAWAVPNGGLVLDPFAGIASCGVAAIAEGCDYIGAECDPQWWPIAERRLAEAQDRPHNALPQASLFADPEAA